MKPLPGKINIPVVAIVIVVILLGGWLGLKSLRGPTNTVSPEDISSFTHQFSERINEKHSLTEVLSSLAEEQQNPHLHLVLDQVLRTMQHGYPLSRAMSQHPDVFNQDYVTIVRAGEKNGSLDQAFQLLAKKDQR